jgi:sugar-specific transcriptional regulator TrmB/AraC-like DNA-binding protein
MDSIQASNDGMPSGSAPDGMTVDGDQAEQILAAIGLGQPEARLYAAVVACPGATADDLTVHARLPTRRARAILGLLVAHGLVSRTANRPARYMPTPPDVAIEPLITRRQKDLQQARALAAELGEQVRRATSRAGGGREAIELLAGREAVGQRFQQLEQAACTEILSFDRPPYYTNELENPGEIAALARGVSVRSVYAPEALDLPSGMDHIRPMARRGEQARVFSPLPLKLFIFDRHTALLPVHPLDPEPTAGTLLVRASALLDALYMFFELIWDRATPLPLDSGRPDTASQADDAVGDLIPLLAVGLTDEAAARQLGISRRTLQRRIQAFMDAQDARSRFQAGYQVGLASAVRPASHRP